MRLRTGHIALTLLLPFAGAPRRGNCRATDVQSLTRRHARTARVRNARRDSIPRPAATLAEIVADAAEKLLTRLGLAATRTDDLRTLDSLMLARKPPRTSPRNSRPRKRLVGSSEGDSRVSLSKVAHGSRDHTARLRWGHQAGSTLEAAGPLRHGGRGTRPIHPRKQHLPPSLRARHATVQEPRLRTPELDALRHRSATTLLRQGIYLGATIASTCYFIDATHGGQLRHQRHVHHARQRRRRCTHLPPAPVRSSHTTALLEGALRRRRLRLDDSTASTGTAAATSVSRRPQPPAGRLHQHPDRYLGPD